MLTQLYFNVYNYLNNLFRREEGQDLAEYAILLGIIAVLVIVTILTIGTAVSNIFQKALTQLQLVPGAGS